VIDLSQKQSAPKRRGRPPKKTLKEEMAELRSVRAEDGEKAVETIQKASESKKEGPFVFKSKYTEDVITLVTPRKIKYEDGTQFVDPGKFATFHRNTWTTYDAVEAQLLRNEIEKGIKLGNPLHIVETTE